MTACPGDEVIAALAEGALEDDERTELEDHVAGCPSCASLVAELAKLMAPSDAGADAKIGRYELAEPLGWGGTGVVVEAFDPLLSRRVAIKIVRPDRPIARDRLLAEARALALLSDPHVLTIHDVIDSQRGICLVTELVDGDPADVWRQRVRPTWPQIRELYLQVARGLVAVHARGLLHRDVKPANVFVGRDGRARLGDFGLVGDGTAALGGTPGFMAPEQAAGMTIDVRADQFALAMAMIHAVAGTVVPAGTTAAALPSDIPAAARQVLARAIAVRPDDRFDRVADMRAALEARPRRWLIAAAGVGLGVASIAVMAGPDASLVALPLVAQAGPAAPSAPTPAPLAAAPPVAGPRSMIDLPATTRDRPRAEPIEARDAAPPDAEKLELAIKRAIGERDANGCAEALAGLVAIDARYEDYRPYCEMFAGRCKAAAAMLRPMHGAAITGVLVDYCPADGDIPEGRLGRALTQGAQGSSPASCARRATWVTTLATTPHEAEMYALHAIQCFESIGRCDGVMAQLGVLAKLRDTTAEAEFARIAPRCPR